MTDERLTPELELGGVLANIHGTEKELAAAEKGVVLFDYGYMNIEDHIAHLTRRLTRDRARLQVLSGGSGVLN